MVFFLPASGTAIRIGTTYQAYTNAAPTTVAGGVTLNRNLGPRRTIGGAIGLGAVTRLSSSFGGQPTNFAYV